MWNALFLLLYLLWRSIPSTTFPDVATTHLEPRRGDDGTSSGEIYQLGPPLTIGGPRLPYWRQVRRLEAEPYRVAADRRHAGTSDESKHFRYLSPRGGGRDRRGQLLVGPASLPGEMAVHHAMNGRIGQRRLIDRPSSASSRDATASRNYVAP